MSIGWLGFDSRFISFSCCGEFVSLAKIYLGIDDLDVRSLVVRIEFTRRLFRLG